MERAVSVARRRGASTCPAASQASTDTKLRSIVVLWQSWGGWGSWGSESYLFECNSV